MGALRYKFRLPKGPGALILTLVYLAFLFERSMAVIVNRTIDDVFGDSETQRRPVFLPTTPGVWKDQSCSDCAIRPDTNRAFRGTYTSATYAPEIGPVNVTMEFNGTAIYIFFILANNAGTGITSLTNCTFKLDGATVGTFQHQPDLTTEDIEYNFLAFSKADIPPGQHQFVAATEGLDFHAYINFDYAIYTYNNDSIASSAVSSLIQATSSISTTQPQATSSSPHPANTDNRGSKAGAIAGGTIGGFACLAIIAILYWSYVRRSRKVSRIDLIGSTEDLPSSGDRGLQGPLSRSGTTHTFAATAIPSTGAPSQTPRRSSADPAEQPHVTNHVSTYNPSSTGVYDTRVMQGPHAPLRIANPDPQAPEDTGTMQEMLLRRELAIMKEEINSLRADLESKGEALPSDNAIRGLSAADLGNERTSQRKRQMATISELEEQTQQLMERIMYLQAQQSPPLAQDLPSESPPGYTPTVTNILGRPFVPDRKKS